ncbi:hypothetical protein SAMN04487977_102621 [Treponema bryantii]|uniref:Uncharacterized protein n=1 Tax=Treponema bryantii TaxID=163 RepID=A0A1H9DNP9_9SPIR|nr:hypothetical protein [Treponema bryantii]SEQ14338.1 hypothetical protein SAMN04487977_102621 [Treponema bryantii]
MNILGNKIIINNKEFLFDKKILEAIEYKSKLILVLDTNEIDNVFCYSFNSELLWRMDSSKIKNVGSEKEPCIGIRIVNDKCVVFDFFGRRYVLNTENGKVERGETFR